MQLFKKKDVDEKKALEQLIKETFCDKQSVVHCVYQDKIWCPETCGIYKRAEIQTKYWNRGV